LLRRRTSSQVLRPQPHSLGRVLAGAVRQGRSGRSHGADRSQRGDRGFEDTAAILSIADLLISIDSAPAHLAGALGRPARIMLGFLANWRWLLERADSPWYPTLRLLRQPKRKDWDSVVAAIAAELRAFQRAE
jgi:ADP-heptose:LPS heptosyltransferase